MEFVIKRNGTHQPFDQRKIITAITSAYKDVDHEITPIATQTAISIASAISQIKANLSVEEIQDRIEDILMDLPRKDVARAYIQWRFKRSVIRRENTTDKTLFDLLCGNSEYWNDENANKNAAVVHTQRDYIAGITSTDVTRRLLLPPEIVEAHDAGIIHFHDADYFAQNVLTNCCLINLEDMLQNGTCINGVYIEKPHRLITATTIATQIITAVSSSQYGGCTVSLSHLAPFVNDSRTRYIKRFYQALHDSDTTLTSINDDTTTSSINGTSPTPDILTLALAEYNTNSTFRRLVDLSVEKEIIDSIQTFNYQINSMTTTNGQAPFISVCMYLNEVPPELKPDLALLIEQMLKQRIQGFKNKSGVYVTPAFPKLLYFLEEDNIHPDSPYYYLTQLACECTAKRMVPDYISEKVMKSLKGDVYPCMGCRSFLTPDRTTSNLAKALDYHPHKYYGRFNQGVVTINLVDVALSSGKDFSRFESILDERLELCHKALRVRHERLCNGVSNMAPIMWQDGALARLDKNESIKELLYHGYSTISLGYAGLYECVKWMTGESLSAGRGKTFAINVMNRMNDACKQWKANEDIDYSVYGTPIESTTYKFAKALKKRFGNDIFVRLDGHDRNYITNSYHIPVFEEINPFDKLKIEGEFQQLSPGGAISYIECADLTKNTDAVMTVVRFIYDNIMYAELNTKSDYCQVCGFDGEIEIVDADNKLRWKCPNCGNMDQSRMNVARRTCGYIGTNFFNQGRTNEIRDRYVHLDDHEVTI